MQFVPLSVQNNPTAPTLPPIPRSCGFAFLCFVFMSITVIALNSIFSLSAPLVEFLSFTYAPIFLIMLPNAPVSFPTTKTKQNKKPNLKKSNKSHPKTKRTFNLNNNYNNKLVLFFEEKTLNTHRPLYSHQTRLRCWACAAILKSINMALDQWEAS